MELFKLKRKAYRQYCKITRDNAETTYKLAQKKLTRNIALSLLSEEELNKNKRLYIYGCLHIFTKNNKITWIKNIKNSNGNWFYKDMNKYNELNILLGIAQ